MKYADLNPGAVVVLKPYKSVLDHQHISIGEWDVLRGEPRIREHVVGEVLDGMGSIKIDGADPYWLHANSLSLIKPAPRGAQECHYTDDADLKPCVECGKVPEQSSGPGGLVKGCGCPSHGLKLCGPHFWNDSMQRLSARTANTEEMSGAGTKHKTATEAVMQRNILATLYAKHVQSIRDAVPAEEKAKYFWKIDMDKLAKPHPRPKLKAHVKKLEDQRIEKSIKAAQMERLAEIENTGARAKYSALDQVHKYHVLTGEEGPLYKKPVLMCHSCPHVRGCVQYGGPTPNCQYRAQGIDINEEHKNVE